MATAAAAGRGGAGGGGQWELIGDLTSTVLSARTRTVIDSAPSPCCAPPSQKRSLRQPTKAGCEGRDGEAVPACYAAGPASAVASADTTRPTASPQPYWKAEKFTCE